LKIADLRKWDCARKQALLENTTEPGAPIPDHISATAKDIELNNGLLAANAIMQDPTYDAVLAAAAIAFGFVFIHPL
jgi:Fic family protein